MAWGLNRLLVAALPFMPRALVGLFARRYVPGESRHQALAVAQELNARGYEATLDILGEHVIEKEEAAGVAHDYVELYQAIDQRGLQTNISLKPTHLGLDIDFETCRGNLLEVLAAARASNNFLRLDMENSHHTDANLALYRLCKERFSGVGPVLQAYLHRSGNDLATLLSASLNVRICKGIYQEPPAVAIQDRLAINANFLQLVRQGFEGEAYLGIATHDLELIAAVEGLIRLLDIPPTRFEFQALYGVPMAGKLRALRDMGYKVRIYIPFGETWYEYSLRRLQENPRILGYVLRNLLRR